MLTYRGGAIAWECEGSGQLSNKACLTKFEEASTYFFNKIGINKKGLRKDYLGFVATEYKINYKEKAVVGDAMYIITQIEAIRTDWIKIGHQMKNANTHLLIGEALIEYKLMGKNPSDFIPIPVLLKQSFLDFYNGIYNN
jgi:acyl-CoA thioesterase FadM